MSSHASRLLGGGIQHLRVPSSPVLQTLLKAGIVEPLLNQLERDTLLK